MNYTEFVEKEGKRIGLNKVVDLIKKVSGKKVLIYTHDDPDGITSGLILTELFEKLGIDYDILIPETMELEKDRLENDIKKDKYDACFVLDKATMGYYDEYYKICENFIVIDHHPLIGEKPKKIVVLNPQLHGDYKSCSCSFILHMLYSSFGFKSKKIDFLNLIGLKGDWAIEPATDYYSDYVLPFIEDVRDNFGFLFEKIEDEPTLFEVKQRKYTTLLNQITEVVFALSGGGFQYFYNDRDESLSDLYQPIFTYKLLKKIDEEKIFILKKREDFFKLIGDEKALLIWKFYKDDWDKVSGYFENCVYVDTINSVDIYMFFGNKIPLMPMIGSVRVYSLPRVKGDEKLLIMVNNLFENGVHFSFRSTSKNLHCGEIAHELIEEILKFYNYPGEITGGGHPFAAEARTRKSGVPFIFALQKLLEILKKRKGGENG